MATAWCNDQEFLASLPDVKGQIAKKLAPKVAALVQFVHEGVTSRTPVWLGTTLRNYVWTMDDAYDGGEMSALGSGPPGDTNNMAVGAEPRRQENQSAADETLAHLHFSPDPFHKYILTNTSEAVEGLEFGLLPYLPLNQRSPEGMFAITFAEAVERLESGVI